MRKCVFCKRRYKKGSLLSFHRFPTDLIERNKWIQNMKASNWIPKHSDSLCSKHFDVKCFVKHRNRSSLKLKSVPTIFEGLFEDQNCLEELEIAVCEPDVSGEKEIDVAEPQSAVLTYPYKYAMSTSPTSESMGTSSSSQCQSPKQRGVKRLLSECNKEDNELQKDSIQYTRNDHNYEASGPSKISRIQYGVAHDHRYENTPRSSKKAAQHMKRSLKLSNSRVKALSQCIKRLKTKVANLKIIKNDLTKKYKVTQI